jgi:hypothetical protein
LLNDFGFQGRHFVFHDNFPVFGSGFRNLLSEVRAKAQELTLTPYYERLIENCHIFNLRFLRASCGIPPPFAPFLTQMLRYRDNPVNPCN